MEQENQSTEQLKFEQKSINQFISKFVSVLLSITTGCVMIMVGFVWSMKGDFATQQQKMEQAIKSIEEIKTDLKTDARDMQTILQVQSRQDQRISNMEEKLRK